MCPHCGGDHDPADCLAYCWTCHDSEVCVWCGHLAPPTECRECLGSQSCQSCAPTGWRRSTSGDDLQNEDAMNAAWSIILNEGSPWHFGAYR
jgi:hypothetical protein